MSIDPLNLALAFPDPPVEALEFERLGGVRRRRLCGYQEVSRGRCWSGWRDRLHRVETIYTLASARFLRAWHAHQRALRASLEAGQRVQLVDRGHGVEPWEIKANAHACWLNDRVPRTASMPRAMSRLGAAIAITDRRVHVTSTRAATARAVLRHVLSWSFGNDAGRGTYVCADFGPRAYVFLVGYREMPAVILFDGATGQDNSPNKHFRVYADHVERIR
ncbi:MAG TPA: hypothetical protein VHH11_13885 [Gammaproteobacteria bacterium]|nr:hypothetical protein [Gammaproteobacteria bacterium]